MTHFPLRRPTRGRLQKITRLARAKETTLGARVLKRTRVCGIALVACLVSASPGVAQRHVNQATPFAIGSTLTGKSVLPHRIHWIAHPRGAAVVEVVFLIDGKKAWVEREAPYSFGYDGNWLVTSALSPGKHRFTVRAKTAGGKTAQRTTIARVLPAVPPPAPLAATWERVVTQKEAGPETPGGKWVLSIDKVGWSVKDPNGYDNWIDAAYLADGRAQLRGGIWLSPFDEKSSTRGGNGWCHESNVPVDYIWAVSADTLTITLAGTDACGDRANKQSQIVAGVWTRAA